MELRVLGAVEAYHEGRLIDLGRRRERCLLGLLLLDVGRPVYVDRLIDLLWDADPPDTALGQLRVNVSRIRARLQSHGAEAKGLRIVTRGNAYVASVDPLAIDVHQFRDQVDAAKRVVDPAARAAALGKALTLWRGPVLGDVATDLLRERVTASLDELHLSAVEMQLEAELAGGRHRDVVSRLVDLSDRHPLRQRLVGLLMLALYRDRRQPEAIEVYHQLRERLARELGLEPDQETRKLHDAVVRADADLDLGPDRDRRRPRQLPLDTFGFRGRTRELDQLDAILALCRDQPTAVIIVALSGTAGVGKTALAVHWAHRVADQFVDGQLYVNLRGFHPSAPPVSAPDAIRGFLDALAVPAGRIPAGFEAQVGLYRSVLAGRRVLVVLDNAVDAEHIRPLLPGASGCVVLVSSRDPLPGLATAEGAHLLQLDLPNDDEARHLLAGRLGARRVAAEQDAVADLIRLCARLPLALAIVAARAATRPAATLGSLASELGALHGSLEAFSGSDPVTDLRAVFSWSVHPLTPPAARMFRLLGLPPGPDISAPAAASLAAVRLTEVRRHLAELVRAQLVVEHLPGRYTCHDLLRAYAGELLGDVDQDGVVRRAAEHRLLDHYLHTAHAADRLLTPNRDPIITSPPTPGVTAEELSTHDQALAWFTAEHAVLLSAVRHAEHGGFDSHAWQLAWTMTAFCQRDGRWRDWVAVQSCALTGARRLSDRPGQAHAHRHLGRAHARLAQRDDAQGHYNQALELYAEIGDPAGQANTHLGLSWLHESQGDREQARWHAEQSLELYLGTTDRAGQARALNSVGWHQGLRGDHQRALTFCQRALALHQETEDREGQAETWDSVGYSHHSLGQHKQAIVSYLEALELCRSLGDRFGEATVQRHLADTYLSIDDPDAARAAWRQALDILDQLDHPGSESVRARLRALDPLPAALLDSAQLAH
jgi:DNA-binding SARP family transcriptional activator/tetratricopeptide (TPR) repeat protein